MIYNGKPLIFHRFYAIMHIGGDEMFLTKKGFRKILFIAIGYFSLGSICIIFSVLFNNIGISDIFLLALGIITYLLCALMVFWGRYAEGKGKLINLGNKLVRKELKPLEFIRRYESLKNSDDLIINKPCLEVLHLVACAYDSLDNREAALAIVDEMIDSSNDKKKNYAKLIKASFLFSYDRLEEAEALFNEAQNQKLDFMCSSLVDAILKSDRAMAMGDYKTVEMFNLKMLERSFPKLDNLGKLVVNYRLGEVYEKLQDNGNAMAYYRYCANFGGETAIKNSAIEKLQYLK